MALRAPYGWEGHTEATTLLKSSQVVDLNDIALNALQFLGPDASRVTIEDFRYKLPVMVDDAELSKAIAGAFAAFLDSGPSVTVLAKIEVSEPSDVDHVRRAGLTMAAECPALPASVLTRVAAVFLTALDVDEAPEISATSEGISVLSPSVRLDSFGGGTRIDFSHPMNETFR